MSFTKLRVVRISHSHHHLVGPLNVGRRPFSLYVLKVTVTKQGPKQGLGSLDPFALVPANRGIALLVNTINKNNQIV